HQLSDMGYKFQFITLAGIHSMWFNMFDLANAYAQGEGMKHYVEKVQQPEFAAAKDGYTFVSHQQEVGTGYFDKVTTIIQGGTSSVTALTGSTEESQFYATTTVADCRPDKAFTPHPAIGARCLMRRLRVLSCLQPLPNVG